MVRSAKFLNHLLRPIAFICAFACGCSAFAATDAGITYQGRILKPDGSPLAGANVQFRLQIRTPGAQNCLMFEELQVQDMRNSKGNFSLTMNDGNGTRTDASGFGLDRVFANKGSFTFDPATCSTGSIYTPSPDDGRKLVVYFKDETMASWEPMPAQNINYVPFALETKQIAGFGIDNLLRVEEADGTLTNITPLSNANYDALKLLVAGTSGLYERAGRLGGSAITGTPAAGQVLSYNGTAWTPVTPTSSGGTVTSVTAGTGLATTPAGGISGAGSIALATLGAGGTGFKVTYDTYGRVTAAVALVEADIPTLTSTGKVAGSAINGTIANGTVINTTGAITGGSVTTAGALSAGSISSTGAISAGGLVSSASGTFTALGTNNLQIFKNATDKVSVTAPSGLVAPGYSLTLPTTAGSANQVLTTDGTGILSWAAQSAATQWSNGGSGAIYYNGGSVGIGTATPSALLDVAGTSGATSFMVRDGAGNSQIATGSRIRHNGSIGIYENSGSAEIQIDDNNDSTNARFGITKDDGSVELFRVQEDGNVGIGVLAPTSKLHVAQTDTSIAGTSRFNLNSEMTVTPTANQATNAYSVGVRGAAIIPNTNTRNVQTVTGAVGYAENNSAGGKSGAVTGSESGAYNSQGNAGWVSGSYNWAESDNGTVDAVAGVSTESYALGGTVTDMYGHHIYLEQSGGTLTNRYGIYLATPLGTATNDYGIYQAGTQKNYFGGKIGIGTTTPQALLDVAGAIRVGDSTTCGAPTSGAIRYNTGNLQFCNGTAWQTLGVAGSGITALTGDVTASGTGSVAATVASVGGSTAALVHSAELLANAATNTNTVNAIVKRDASGNFWGNIVNSNRSNQRYAEFRDNSVNVMTLQAAANMTGSYALTYPAGLPASNGQVLSSNTSGVMSWVTPSTAPTGAAGGDLSGTYPNPSVATVGGSTAAQVHAAELLANAATAANTNSAIVARDSAGSFVANNATLNSVTLKNSSAQVIMQSPVGANYTLTLPGTAGTSNQVLTTNGSGVLSWTSAASGSQWTTTASDIYYSTGKVGVGTSTPATSLDVVGSARASTSVVAPLFTSTAGATLTLQPGGAASNGAVLNVFGGDPAAGNAGNGGTVMVSGGQGSNFPATGGAGGGGDLILKGGNAGTGGNQYGGTVNIYAGASEGRAGSNVNITGGSSGFSDGGSVVINGGTTTNGGGGSVLLTASNGAGSNQKGGDIRLTAGSPSGSGAFGTISMMGGKVGVGTTTPSATLEVSNQTNASLLVTNTDPTSNPGSQIQLRNYRGGWGGGDPAFISYVAKGSAAAPAPVTAGMKLMSLQGRGYADTGYGADREGASIDFVAKDNWANSVVTTDILFNTVPFGDWASYERMRITSEGKVGIGTNAPGSPLDVVSIRKANSGVTAGAHSLVSVQPTATSANFTAGMLGEAVTPASNTFNTSDEFGVYGWSQNTSASGSINNVSGVKGTAYHDGTGTTVFTAGVFGEATTTTGLVQKAYGGTFRTNNNGGTISEDIPLYGRSKIDPAATVVDRYMLKLSVTGTGVPTGNDYGIYQDYASQTNYFAGSMAVGTTTATEKMTVSGNVLATAYLYSSDRRLKKDITPIESALAKVLRLNGVTYRWITPLNEEADREQLGVIAQDVEAVFPQAVTVSRDGTKRVNYPMLVAPVIEAVKELHETDLAHDRKLASIEERAARAEAKVQELQKKLDAKDAEFEARIRALEKSLRIQK